MKTTTDITLKFQLNHAYLEDREHYAQLYTELPSDRYAQVITGKVQDALLKQEAAIAVRYTYRRLLDLLKKVSIKLINNKDVFNKYHLIVGYVFLRYLIKNFSR